MHEDSRRSLIDIPYRDGELKIIVAKTDCKLGNHYHKIKTEKFILIDGYAEIEIDGSIYNLKKLDWITVYPNQLHKIDLQKDSILNCICSHPYDPEDDYQ